MPNIANIDVNALDKKAWLSKREMCAYFGIGDTTLMKEIANGLPYATLNGRYKFERTRVKKYLYDKSRGATFRFRHAADNDK